MTSSLTVSRSVCARNIVNSFQVCHSSRRGGEWFIDETVLWLPFIKVFTFWWPVVVGFVLGFFCSCFLVLCAGVSFPCLCICNVQFLYKCAKCTVFKNMWMCFFFNPIKCLEMAERIIKGVYFPPLYIHFKTWHKPWHTIKLPSWQVSSRWFYLSYCSNHTFIVFVSHKQYFTFFLFTCCRCWGWGVGGCSTVGGVSLAA